MLRPPASRRTALVLAVPLALGAGIGLAAPVVWSASSGSASTTSQYVPHAAATTPSVVAAQAPKPQQPGPQAATATTAPAPAAAPAGGELSLVDAMSVATGVAPGRVVEAKEDNELTGRTYDVKVAQQNGTVVELELDAATGRVLSSQLKD